jgi:hypothetical protein
MPGLLGQLTAWLDFQAGEQSGDETGGCPAGFDPGETARE